MASNNMRRIKRIHLVGIGGSGMGGIAEVLLNLGYEVSGSDLNRNATVAHLQSLGVDIKLSHEAEHIIDKEVVVVSSAIASDNVEVLAARQARIPIVPRAVMLAELMRFKQGIAVAGTHGKTTTTSLVAFVLAEAGLDPTFVVGGRLNSLGSNARLGGGQYFVVEADESDASFLHFYPLISIVTNIDRDHLEAYAEDYDTLKDTYLKFLHQLPFYGLAVLCIDDESIQSILPQVSRPFLTYGFSKDADYYASDYQQVKTTSSFTFHCPKRDIETRVVLNLPGKHNVLNALSAMVVALEEGVKLEHIKNALAHFGGINRRFDILGHFPHAGGQIMLIDDYGHHPREIEVVIETLRAGWPDRRLVFVFQPHRVNRTRLLFEDFAALLSGVADQLILLEIYSAGEKPIPGIDSRTLARAIRARGRVDPLFVHDNKDLTALVHDIIQPNDIILTMGAGSVGGLALQLKQSFEQCTTNA